MLSKTFLFIGLCFTHKNFNVQRSEKNNNRTAIKMYAILDKLQKQDNAQSLFLLGYRPLFVMVVVGWLSIVVALALLWMRWLQQKLCWGML